MARKKKGGDHGGGGGHDNAGGLRWLLTYTDMVTLLLATFIIMWATSQTDIEKFEQVQAALAQAFGFGQASVLRSGGAEGAKPSIFKDSQLQVQKIKDKMQRYVREQRLDTAINIHLNERGVLIRVYADKVNFEKGSAALPPQYMNVLNHVATILETTPNSIYVNGYTDDLPSQKEGGNWALSAMRAVNTVKYLQKRNIAPERMVASGYGEYSPLVPNSDPVRRSMNRRIDIQVMKAPILEELHKSERVREEFNPEVAPMAPPALSPVEGVNPKPLTF